MLKLGRSEARRDAFSSCGEGGKWTASECSEEAHSCPLRPDARLWMRTLESSGLVGLNLRPRPSRKHWDFSRNGQDFTKAEKQNSVLKPGPEPEPEPPRSPAPLVRLPYPSWPGETGTLFVLSMEPSPSGLPATTHFWGFATRLS